MTQAELATEALTWVGTPFQANQRTKGIGADCIGVVVGIAIACGVVIPGLTLAYPMRPNGTLQPYLDKHLIRIAGEPQPGDVLLMSFAGEPHHVAMLVDGDRIVHAYTRVRKCVIQSYTDYWRSLVLAVYRFQEVA